MKTNKRLMFKTVIAIVAVIALSSCGNDGVTTGKYHGQYFLEEVDISQVPDRKLTILPLASREGMEGIFDTDNELKTMIEWEVEATKKIGEESDIMARVALQSDMMCQCVAFADLDYIPLVGMKNYEVDSIYKEKGVVTKNRQDLTGKPRRLIDDLLFFDFGTQKTWIDTIHKEQVYFHAKKNCKAYQAYLDVDETDYLRTLKGKADTEYEANRLHYYIDRGVGALSHMSMPMPMRRKEYLNLLCQHFQARNNLLEDGELEMKLRARATAAMLAAGENGEIAQELLDAAKKFDDAEAAQGVAEEFEEELFSKRYFEILDLPYDSKHDERQLRKELAATCPAYLEFVEAKQKGILTALRIMSKTGLMN